MFFQADGFKLLNGDFAKSFKIPFGHDAIHEMLLKRAIEKKKLKNELSGVLVSIKFYRLISLRSHFLGISAQYFNIDYGLTTKISAPIDIKANHTSSNLKNHMRCAEHTFHLGIRDVLKKGRPEKFLSNVQNRSVPMFPSHRHCFET